MITAAPVLPFAFHLPDGLRYDGIQGTLGRMGSLLCFTEMDESYPAFGGSFAIDEELARACPAMILVRRMELNVEFAAAQRSASFPDSTWHPFSHSVAQLGDSR